MKKSNYKVKAIWTDQVWVDNKTGFKERHFIFDISNAEHKKLRSYCSSGYYWFEGLSGNDWYRGGHFINPLINPKPKVKDNVQGFTDGTKVYLLREVLTESELLNKYNETQLDAMIGI